MKNVASIHWGYSIGGVGKYASIIDKVHEVSDIEIHNIVILSPNAHVDEDTMHLLCNLEIIQLKSKFDLSWLWKLRRRINDKNADLLLTHGFNGHFLMMVEKYLLGLNVPLVCSYHGEYHATTPVRKIFGVVFNRLTEFYIRRCVISAVAVADYCRTFLINKNVNSNKIAVIHNGISDTCPDDNKRFELRDEWDVQEDEILIGVASRIDPVKGIEYLISAFMAVSEKYPKLKLLVIGTGTLEDKLKLLVKQNHMDSRVIFTGFRTDINDCLAAMDIFALPSLAEYHSIGLLEAMRAQKAIVATDVGGNTESVRDEREGLIVKAADVADLSEALARLAKDSDLRARLGAAAYERFCAEFTEEAMLIKTSDWLQAACCR